MKKTWRKTIILFAIPLLVIASIVCCCFENAAQAAEEPSASSCHTTTKSQQGNDASGPVSSDEDCDCVQTIGLLAQKIVPAVKLAVFTFPNVEDILSLNSIADDASVDVAMTRAYQGPPQTAINSLPIYLQISDLRL